MPRCRGRSTLPGWAWDRRRRESFAHAAKVVLQRVGGKDVVFDGSMNPLPFGRCEPKADATYPCVAAASIVGKVFRTSGCPGPRCNSLAMALTSHGGMVLKLMSTPSQNSDPASSIAGATPQSLGFCSQAPPVRADTHRRITETDLAYLAGFFDGEGCLALILQPREISWEGVHTCNGECSIRYGRHSQGGTRLVPSHRGAWWHSSGQEHRQEPPENLQHGGTTLTGPSH